MPDIGVGNGGAACDLIHLIDAAARRIHFDSQFAISGARIQAQAAVYAFIQIRLRGSARFCHTNANGSEDYGGRTSV